VNPALVTLTDVVRRYGAVTAVDRLTLDVRHGELFGLIGPDGAGKTTSIKLMAGLLAPEAGAVRVAGHDPVRDRRATVGRTGYLSQRFSLYGDLSIDENVAFFAEIHGVRDYGARRDRLLDLTGLLPFRSRLAERLSGGMKQKLALVCTLVHEPELLLLDEPTTGVDPVARREFWMLLSELIGQGITIVMATPYLDEAERCSRVAFLHEGRLLAFDVPARLRASYTGDMLEVLATPHDRAGATLAGLPGLSDFQSFGERIHVRLRHLSPSDAMATIEARLPLAGVRVDAVRAIAPTLEDVFIERLDAAGAVEGSHDRA
jgi:ABC-2 type transport system ATP-binding protein